MKAVVFLRVASVLTLIHSILHTVGGVFGKPPSPTAIMVLATMRGNRFPFMGEMRSYADFLHGMGLAVTIFLTAEAVVFWLLSSLAKSEAARLRPLMAVFLLAYLAMAVNSLMFFFLGAVITELCITAALFAAIITASSTVQVQHPELKPVQS